MAQANMQFGGPFGNPMARANMQFGGPFGNPMAQANMQFGGPFGNPMAQANMQFGNNPYGMPGAQYQQQQYAQYMQLQQKQMQIQIQAQQAFLQQKLAIQQDWMHRQKLITDLKQEIFKINHTIELVGFGRNEPFRLGRHFGQFNCWPHFRANYSWKHNRNWRWPSAQPSIRHGSNHNRRRFACH